MGTAALLLRPEPKFRFDGFAAGLEGHGLTVSRRAASRPSSDDVLILWNRYPQREHIARSYERAGAAVLVAENGYLGREWRGGVWYAISRNHHNGAGNYLIGGDGRWDGWGVEIAPWCPAGREIVILAQRGFGHRDVREPKGWAAQAAAMLRRLTDKPIRVRAHPGERGNARPLQDDLSDAWACVTWGSGAALKALQMGVPVFNGFRHWIGRDAARPLREPLQEPFRGDRLPMFRKLAWAMWELNEIASGDPFKCLLR